MIRLQNENIYQKIIQQQQKPTYAENLATFGQVVPQTCMQADIHTDMLNMME